MNRIKLSVLFMCLVLISTPGIQVFIQAGHLVKAIAILDTCYICDCYEGAINLYVFTILNSERPPKWMCPKCLCFTNIG
ncbi:hypothetical protein EWB00_009644 [Schistosoma japonicum]|uniref:Secreted protein n=1 Tax=Schistosoma japonicum TaxID=6182 RepID=A0A4Z2CLH0_SCHJA|nr:hypothetical protein EWB00_009644 [Schistosoma japonicum]